MSLGRLIGGGIGFLVGGPQGAAIGMGLGGAAEEATGGGASGAAEDAAQAANAASDRNLALQQRVYEEGIARQQPFYQASVNALPGYLQGIGQDGNLVRGFTQADYQADPGYAFRLSEGMKTLERGAASRGNLMSGATMKELQRYGQGLASQEYNNAYNRFRDTQGLQRNALAGVVGYGPTSANAMGNMGQNYALGAGSIMNQQGVNTGNALLAGQQARSSAYGQVGSALGKYLGNSGFGGSGFGGTGINPASGEYYGSLEF